MKFWERAAIRDLLTELDRRTELLRRAEELNHGLGLALKANKVTGTATAEAVARESEAVMRAENHQLRRALKQSAAEAMVKVSPPEKVTGACPAGNDGPPSAAQTLKGGDVKMPVIPQGAPWPPNGTTRPGDGNASPTGAKSAIEVAEKIVHDVGTAVSDACAGRNDGTFIERDKIASLIQAFADEQTANLRCGCSCGDACPFGKTGSSERCTAKELQTRAELWHQAYLSKNDRYESACAQLTAAVNRITTLEASLAKAEADRDVLRKSAPKWYGMKKWLHWAIDLIDAYDARLLELGEPVEMVNSSAHITAKKMVRDLVGLPSLFDEQGAALSAKPKETT